MSMHAICSQCGRYLARGNPKFDRPELCCFCIVRHRKGLPALRSDGLCDCGRPVAGDAWEPLKCQECIDTAREEADRMLAALARGRP